MTARHPSRLFPQRDRQVLDYLLSVADSEGKLTDSTYAIARGLGMHRQTLTRVLHRLDAAGAVTLDDHACRPIRVTQDVTNPVTNPVTQDVTNVVTLPVTSSVTNAVTHPVTADPAASADTVDEIGSCSITCTIPVTPRYVSCGAENITFSRKSVTFSLESVTFPLESVTLLATIATPTVTDKKETKQKNEEIPPAPPKEEKKQKKEKNSPTNACVREEISTKSDEERLEQRRQRFVDALQPFAERYGKEMIGQFAEYWTEPNRSNTRMRFELQRTWSTSLRLARWARNDNAFNTPPSNNRHHDNSNNASNDNSSNNYSNYGNNRIPRPTSEDYVRAAQEYAIAQTEQFIREAEMRRGGVPPHLPF